MDSRRFAVARDVGHGGPFDAAGTSHLLNLIVLGLGLLMLIVLIQRGKGGGLAGAFGGAGGSSPFGSRAADQFVKITLWLAGRLGAGHHDPRQGGQVRLDG